MLLTPPLFEEDRACLRTEESEAAYGTTIPEAEEEDYSWPFHI